MSVIGLIVSVLMGIIGVIFRRLGMLDARLREAPDRDEVRQLVRDKLEATVLMQKELKEDIKDLSAKIDRLLSRG